MAQVVAAFGISHAAIMVRAWDQAAPEQRDAVRKGFDEVSRRLYAAKPDAVVVIGNDHFMSFFLDVMPAFCFGVCDKSKGYGDGGIPRYEVSVDRALAEELLDGVMRAGLTPAYSTSLSLDHAFMTPVHMVMPKADLPIVPIVQNCNAPPLAAPKACFELGRAIRQVIEASPLKRRVAVIGTGGISHWIPLWDWRELARTGERPLQLTRMSSREGGRSEAVRQAIGDEVLEWSRQGRGRINESFDREFLARIVNNDYATITNYTYELIDREAGNGGQEIRNWMTMLGVVPDWRAEAIFYQPVKAWLTGIGGVALSPR